MTNNHDYSSLPIPTYEEAISSRPSSSQHTGPTEPSDDAERQGLLGQPGAPRGPAGYHAPTATSPRASEDSDLYLPEVTGEEDDDEANAVRRDMEEMEMLDPDSSSPSRLSDLSKRISYLTHSLSTMRLPSLPSGWSLPTAPRVLEGFKKIPLNIVARLCGLAVLGVSVWLLWHFKLVPMRGNMAVRYNPDSVREHVLGVVDKDKMADSLRYITSFDHVAGTEGDLFLAQWMYERWQGMGFDVVEMLNHKVYLNYPTPSGRRVGIPELGWEAQLEEDSAGRFSGQTRQQTLVWHGGSRAGNVTGHLVYANGGSRGDFQQLKDMGVQVEGSVALVKYHGSEHNAGLKVKAAEQAGAVGCIVYSDPADDGMVRGEVVPNGPWRPADSVQRAGVYLRNWILGDPLTKGFPSEDKSHAGSENDNLGLVNIPSLPLAWRDAQKLLQVIAGKGQPVPQDWIGGVPDVGQWSTGGADSPVVLLQNLQDENQEQTIWNVRGHIKGIETPAGHVIVGNHRDAWCFGAVDPGSGSAVMMEVARIFGDLLDVGWRPLRSIEFLSWDAGEFNMMGSTEYVESHVNHLRMHGQAYLNVGAGVAGPDFRASASPLFQDMLLRVLDRVTDPVSNKTLKVLWLDHHTELQDLDTDGDHVAFQQIAGMPALDFGFTGPKHGYPADSCYDSFEWMEKFGDPSFDYHQLLAQVWALMILEIVDAPMLPYDLTAYAKAIESYVEALETDVVSQAKDGQALDLSALANAANSLFAATQQFHEFESHWTSAVLSNRGMETNAIAVARIRYNEKMAAFEKDLLDVAGMFDGDKDQPHGLPSRDQYKHIIFGPLAWQGQGVVHFPGVRDALDRADMAAAQQQTNKAARIIERAAQRLLD